MSPWTEKNLVEINLASGTKVVVETRGIPSKKRELWILIHGMGGDRKGIANRTLFRRLRERGAVVVAPDLPGHGESGGKPTDLTIGKGLELMDILWDKWGKRSAQVFLVGFSLGGLIAAWWAAQRENNISGLILLGPVFRPWELIKEMAGKEAIQWAIQKNRPLELKEGDRSILVGPAFLTEGSTFPVSLLIQNLQCRGLVIHGSRDRTSPWRDSLDFALSCQGLFEFTLLPNGGHLLHGLEELVAQRIITWTKTFAPSNKTPGAPSLHLDF